MVEPRPYAAATASAEAIGFQPMARDMNMRIDVVDFFDGFAVVVFISGRGVETVRHLDTDNIWAQV